MVAPQTWAGNRPSPRSRGGDLFTDFDAELKEIYGARVHGGVLLAALALERELRRRASPSFGNLVWGGFWVEFGGIQLVDSTDSTDSTSCFFRVLVVFGDVGGVGDTFFGTFLGTL